MTTPESMGQELAMDIEAFAHDQRKTHPDKVPTKEELRQQLVGTLGPRD